MATISPEAQEILESKGWSPQESRALLKGISTQQDATKEDLLQTEIKLRDDIHELNKKIESTANALDKKIDSVKSVLETKFDVLHTELRYVKWIGAAIVVGVFLPWIRSLWML